MSSLQMTLPDSEPTIAGKTHSEILAMKKWNRESWYKKILPEEKEEVMRIVGIAGRAKISTAMTGRTFTKEHKAKISEALMGENNPSFGGLSEEHKAKLSVTMTGRTISEEHKAKTRAGWTPERRAKISAAMSGENNPNYGRTGENHPNWRGGTSFEPYCPAFNGQLKEKIRNRDNRTCVLCGTGEIQNGQRLSVHHIRGDKMEGCNDKRWYLCALCHSCNSRPDTVEKEFLIMTKQNRIGEGR